MKIEQTNGGLAGLSRAGYVKADSKTQEYMFEHRSAINTMV